MQAKITVPASLRNTAARSKVWRTTERSVGRRYGGSSSKRGIRRPFTTVRPSTPAAASAVRVENRYMNTMRRPCTGSTPNTSVGGNSAAMISVYTGKRAEQVIRGMTSMVKSRSRSRSMVRVAMMAGMAQAQPLSMGTKARPWRPRLFMMRSIRYAARAM